MKRCLPLILLPLIAGAAESPLTVSLADLVKHPQRYDGRRISVRAYALTSPYECSEFWQSRESARYHYLHRPTTRPCIAIGRVAAGHALPKWFATRLFKLPPRREGYDGYVHVVGTFRYIDLQALYRLRNPSPTPRSAKTKGPPTKNPEAERVIVWRTMGFGMWGLYDKTITDMTEVHSNWPGPSKRHTRLSCAASPCI
jgi:hypothetical protein